MYIQNMSVRMLLFIYYICVLHRSTVCGECTKCGQRMTVDVDRDTFANNNNNNTNNICGQVVKICITTEQMFYSVFN